MDDPLSVVSGRRLSGRGRVYREAAGAQGQDLAVAARFQRRSYNAGAALIVIIESALVFASY
jgi:hypothetical protein